MTFSPATSERFLAQAPHVPEASERCVLGTVLYAALIGQPEAVEAATSMLPPEAFYVESHRTLWQVILDLHRNGGAVTEATLGDELRAQGVYDRVGGAAYLSDLLDAVDCANPLADHIEAVRGAWARRTSCLDALQGVEAARSGAPLDEVAAHYHRAAEVVLPRSSGYERGDGLAELLAQTAERKPVRLHLDPERCWDESDPAQLGEMLGLLFPGQLMVVAAGPGVGKTSFLLSAAHSGSQHGTRVVYLSLEDSHPEMESRLASHLTGVPYWRIQASAYESQAQREAVEAAVAKVRALPLWIDWMPGADRRDVGTAIRRAVQHRDAQLVVVDYLQKIVGDSRQGLNEATSAHLGEVARAMGRRCAVIAGSQISREGRKSGKPGNEDLRDSGTIEERARKVLILTREGEPHYEKDARGKPHADRQTVLMRITKNTNGEVGECRGTIYLPHSLVWPGQGAPRWSALSDAPREARQESFGGCDDGDPGPEAPDCGDEWR